MDSIPRNHRLENENRAVVRCGPGRLRSAVVVVAAFALTSAGHAFCQTVDKPKKNNPSLSQSEPKGKTAAKCKTGPTATANRQGSDKPDMTQGLSPKHAGPRWACDETTIIRKPVWRGEPVVCDFKVRNEGTEDLQIKARGG